MSSRTARGWLTPNWVRTREMLTKPSSSRGRSPTAGSSSASVRTGVAVLERVAAAAVLVRGRPLAVPVRAPGASFSEAVRAAAVPVRASLARVAVPERPAPSVLVRGAAREVPCTALVRSVYALVTAAFASAGVELYEPSRAGCVRAGRGAVRAGCVLAAVPYESVPEGLVRAGCVRAGSSVRAVVLVRPSVPFDVSVPSWSVLVSCMREWTRQMTATKISTTNVVSGQGADWPSLT
ncbi:hypothetical protein ACWC4A_54560, partial [Streptomyces mirabilis]